jgi:hypothetical protein
MREQAYRNLCLNQGLTYLNKDEFGVIRYLELFELFRHTGGKISNLSQLKSSNLDHEINIFDYKYTIMVGKVPVTIQQTVFFVNSKSLDLPIFLMKPESMGNRIAAYFGYDDIDFEEYPTFSEKYNLTGEHEEFIRSAFDDKVLHFFSKANDWSIEATNYYLIFYRNKELIPDNSLIEYYTVGLGVYDMFKI